MAPNLTVVPEYRQVGVGRPDIALVVQGTPARAFVELKAISKPADPTRWRQHDKRQFERFKELSAWSTCNFHEFRLLSRGEQTGQAIVVPEIALRPNQNDANADQLISEHNFDGFLQLLGRLCASAGVEPIAQDAKQLANLLAHSARLIRGIIQDRLTELHAGENQHHALLQVRQTFRDVLYSHPEAGGYNAVDFDTLFSAAFAQTLAFGLLLVRESTGESVGSDSWQHMPEEHPLMRTTLRVLSEPEVIQDMGIGFDIICDTINCFAPELLAIGEDNHDPILYFYEDFLETFDPEAREKYGVYYTPIEVVRYMVGALDRILRDNLGTEGLQDPNVTILDPATGTGTFLLGIAERVRLNQAGAGEGMTALVLQDLASRMYGFELLVGPYAVAHYRLHHALRSAEGNGEPAGIPRLGVFLADTLAEPGAAAVAGPLGFMAEGMSEESREANRVKNEQSILAIIGNPPYRRLEEGENHTLVGDWMDELWDDLKEPVRDAGKGGQLNTFPELSVAFWRWSMWKLFEAENAPRRGVIAFITNRKFLTGWPYSGLRKMMRERFDRIEIIDLRGDVRTGERAGVERDQGIFNIMVGTSITLAVADGSKEEGVAADIFYHDCWEDGHFARRTKLDWLNETAEIGLIPNNIAVERDWLDDFRPQPFLNGQLVGLQDCFTFSLSGIQTKRDKFVYSFTRESLAARIENFTTLSDIEAKAAYPTTAAKPWNTARAQPFSENFLTLVAYRPMDRRWLYNHEKYIDRRRPELQNAWGNNNVCLYAMPGGTGAGPAVWCHGLLPDYHAFRGRGGYAFPMYDRRKGPNANNLSTNLITNLSAAYGEAVVPEDVFDCILCLLSASSYSLRFAEDLEDVFPHIPFPSSFETFHEAAQLGAEIRAVETFTRPPTEEFLPEALCQISTQPRGVLAHVDYADGEVVLCEDGSGIVTGIPEEIWMFSVSGYRLLPHWLESRIGQSVDLALVRELRDICGRITELLDLFATSDILLESTLDETLTREALGLDAEE